MPDIIQESEQNVIASVVLKSLNDQKAKIVEFANSVDPDEVAHNEPPHLDLQCLPSCLRILSIVWMNLFCFLKFCRCILLSPFLAL